MKFLIAILLLSLTACAQDNQLEYRSFFDEKVQILIPKDFHSMSQAMINQRYKRGALPPAYILSDSSGNVNVIISHLDIEMRQDEIEVFKNALIEKNKKLFPKAIWKGNGVGKINGKEVGFTKFVTRESDDSIFNYIFFTSMGGKILLCTFNCLETSLPKWENTSEEIVKSLLVM